MACNNDQFRHVCLKDLENYIKRDKYFSDFTKDELALIQKNLGYLTSDDLDKYTPQVIKGKYSEIQALAAFSSLKIGYIYVITDFRTLYLDEDNKICGFDDHIPSAEYWLFLTPNSTNTFDSRVRLCQPTDMERCTKWTVEYDITPKQLKNGITTRGSITYLKDAKNNYAYYDFKNIRFKKTLEELNKGATTFTEDQYLYTFDDGGIDTSETICTNNHLEQGAYRNVFLGYTCNTNLGADCHDNIFFGDCIDCSFGHGTCNSYFTKEAIQCSGIVTDKTVSSLISEDFPKQFIIIADKQIVTYVDPQTQAFQTVEL